MKSFLQHPNSNGIASWPVRIAHNSGRVALLAALFLWCAGPVARAHQSPPGCAGSGLGIELFTDSPKAHIGDTVHYSINVFNGSPGNPLVACDATAIRAFITSPDGVTNSIALVRTNLSNGQSDFYFNAVTYVVRAQDVRPDGTVRAMANDIGVIHQNDTDSMGGGFQGVNTEVIQPCIQITAQCVGGVGENGAITFSGQVTNCGNVALNNVTVTNYINGQPFLVFGPTTLNTNQSQPFSGSYVPTNPCSPSTTTLSVRGVDDLTITPRIVINTTTITCSDTLTAGIRVTKACGTAPTAPGQPMTFTGSVSNTGNVTLTNVVVVNDRPVANTVVFTQATLAPGETATFSGSYPTPTNACSVTDTLTATARSRCGVAVTHAATATCTIVTAPAITVSTTCPTAPVAPGGTVSYSGTVQNTGNVTLNNVVVVSDRPAANTVVYGPVTLAPGASANFSGAYTMPAGACSATTITRATGRDSCTSVNVTNIATTTCFVTTTRGLVVTLACPTTPVATGAAITYTGSVRNSGNVTLSNVVVVNNNPAPDTVVFVVPSLAPGAITNFAMIFTTPTNSCSVSTTVGASGIDTCAQVTVSNSASATCPLTTTGRIVVTHSCPPNPATPGGPLVYSGTVSNAGNITLTNVVVLNDRTGNLTIFAANTLAPGQTASFTGSYIVPTNSGCAVSSILTAGGDNKCTGVRVFGSASATCPLVTAPRIVVTQTCPVTPVAPGGILTYTGTVSNAGNVTLTNVVVYNNRPATNTVIFTIATLAPGAKANFTGSYQVPLNCCVIDSTVKAQGRDICTGAIVMDTFTAICPVLTTPKIVVTKVCPTKAVRVGDLMEFSGIVSNAGNITLVNVTIVNDQPVIGTPVFGPITLAPGEAVSYTGSYTVAPDYCGTDTVWAQGADACTWTYASSTATATCPVTTTPRITVTKNCPTSPTPRGGVFTFTATVRNAGDVTLLNVIVTNNYQVDCFNRTNARVFGPVTLAPGESVNFSGSYTAPRDCCQVMDTLTASGNSRCSNTRVTGTATAICPLLSTPDITVTKVCPSSPVAVGGLFTFSGVVSNSGDVALTNVTVKSSQPGGTVTLLGPIALAPGETKTYTGSYTVTANSDPASDSVTARGRDICEGRSVCDTVNCYGCVETRIINLVNNPSGSRTVTWAAAPGSVYMLQAKDTSQGTNWVNIPGTVTATGDTASKEDATAAGKQRFYRVEVLE